MLGECKWFKLCAVGLVGSMDLNHKWLRPHLWLNAIHFILYNGGRNKINMHVGASSSHPAVGII